MKIRKAQHKDIPEISQLFIQMLRHIESLKTGNHDTHVSGYEDGFLEVRLAADDALILVSEENDHVTGFLSIEKKQRGHEAYLYLDDFCVDEKHRGTGTGTALLEEAVSYAVKNHFPVLILHVFRYNTGAFDFYAKRGFTVLSEQDERCLMKKTVGSVV